MPDEIKKTEEKIDETTPEEEVVDEELKDEEVKEDPEIDEEPKAEEVKEMTKEQLYDSITAKQIKEQLDHLEVEYNKFDDKKELFDLLQEKLNVKVEELEEEAKVEEVKAVEIRKNEEKLIVKFEGKTLRVYRRSTHGKIWRILAKNLTMNSKYKGAKIVKG